MRLRRKVVQQRRLGDLCPRLQHRQSGKEVFLREEEIINVP